MAGEVRTAETRAEAVVSPVESTEPATEEYPEDQHGWHRGCPTEKGMYFCEIDGEIKSLSIHNSDSRSENITQFIERRYYNMETNEPPIPVLIGE